MSSLEWASGLFEGEGSFVCTRIKNRKNSYKVHVVISSTDRDVLETFQNVVGFGPINGPYKPSNGKKMRYVWEVQNYRDCLKISELLYPYLHSRRKEKANILIKLCKERLLGKT
ncbi:MAG: hypothetical protein EKK63_10000 [Acinetobacter sp.]|uniref:LAGLIDADG family homing endonuclease n=1 Tax=Acinetobacter sp. TaxID=472 RepID=UPI000FA82C47|nr:LAGLIDADG family homing endonuclease [Acinetobacter sp.]RUP39323.1 MAG: hypothetical protein EKK63_10000 [Acinetobacter sp.]